MEFACRRCDQITKQKPYRVTTEDCGVVLLNMLVCPSCARLARRLGLESAKRAAKTKGVQATTDSKQQPVRPPPSIR